MTTQHIETLVIGAGQAGLATGYHLQRLDRPFLIVDANERIGDNWRQQWDSLRLYTPAKYDGLPGMPFPQAPWSYPHKDEVADYLERYALHWDLPVRTSTRVDALTARPEVGYSASLGADTIGHNFQELGARSAEAEVARLLRTPPPRGLTHREVEVLRLVATGIGNPEIASKLVLSDKTVARPVSWWRSRPRVPPRRGTWWSGWSSTWLPRCGGTATRRPSA